MEAQIHNYTEKLDLEQNMKSSKGSSLILEIKKLSRFNISKEACARGSILI